MSKKYLSLEEAAEKLGMSTTDLNRLREKQQIRAFADRGSWKFKEEDVDTLARTREADSSPDVPLHSADDSSVLDDEDVLGSQPTVIRKGGVPEDSSDSDVRLIFDDPLSNEEGSSLSVTDDSHSDVKLAASGRGHSDSDSDVKLAGPSSAIFDTGSDSDVKLVTDDSSITGTTGSDSDVRLVSSESSGEIRMTGSADDSSVLSADPSGSSVISSESGISLGEDSNLALASDSGISLEGPADSGISLSEEGSILLDSDSGISLAGDMPLLQTDSGISLAPEAGASSGSGISLAPGGKAPKKPVSKKQERTQGDDDLGATIPLMEQTSAGEGDLLDTAMEVPNLSDSSESTDLFGSSAGDSTNVITLDEEEGSGGYDVTADIPVGGSSDFDDEVVAEDDEEPVDISDEIIGEDDELEEDVFGAEDEDFAADDLESGESSAELPVAPRVMVAAAEQEWGTGVHITLVLATILTVVVGIVTFDLVRNMWHTDMANHTPLSTMFVDLLKDM